jgi:predicted phage tail protein
LSAEVDLDIPVVRWQPLERSVRTMLRVEPRSTGATPLREYEVSGGEYRIEGLAPGRYEATLRLVYPNGVRSEPGEAAGFRIPLLLRDGSGRPVGSSAGPIRLPES